MLRNYLFASIVLCFVLLSFSAFATKGIVVYGESGVFTPRYRVWDGSDFGNEYSASDITNKTQWTVTKWNPIRNESVMGILTNNGTIKLQVWNSTDWGNFLDTGANIGNVNEAYRAFDIAYEQFTGRAIVVYEKNTAADQLAYYRIWNGSDWSSETELSLPSGTDGNKSWIKLEPLMDSDEILLGALDSNADLYAMIWNGTHWTNGQTIYTNVSTTSRESFSMAWEGSSQNAFIIFGRDTTTDFWRWIRSNSSWVDESGSLNPADAVQNIRACAEPYRSDYVGVIMVDAGSDANVGMWNGSTWLSNVPAQDGTVENVNTRTIDCAWLFKNSNGVALFGFIDNNALTIDYVNFTRSTGSWSNTSLVNAKTTSQTWTDDIEVLQFTQKPKGNKIMAVGIDLLDDVRAIEWDSNNWSAPNNWILETTASSHNRESAMFDWNRFLPMLKDQIFAPCTTNYTDRNDRCKVNANVNDVLNLTFNYVEAVSYDDVYDQTLRLKWGKSNHPKKNDADKDSNYTTECGDNKFILQNVYVTTCTGFESCTVESDGDVRLLQTNPTTGYNATIGFEVKVCNNKTTGKTYDFYPKNVIKEEGKLIADSYVTLDINPTIMWNRTTSVGEQASPAIADVNGDTAMDVVIGSLDNSIYLYNGSNGNQNWSFSTGGEVYSSPAVANILSDTGQEIVVGSCDNNIYLINSTGDQKWSYATDGCVASSPGIANIDGVGGLEIVVGSEDGKVYALDSNGNSLWNYTTNNSIWSSSPSIADVLSDSGLETAIASYDGYVYLLNSTGNQKWNYSLYNNSDGCAAYPDNTEGCKWIDSSPAIGDIDNDTIKDVVIGARSGRVYALKGSDGSLLWSRQISDWLLASSPVLADLNNDTKLEVIIGSGGVVENRVVVALDGTNGNVIWNYTSLGQIDASPAIADINNDTWYDVITGDTGNTILALNGLDGSQIWNYTADSYIFGSPAVADLNGDGDEDIVATTYDDAKTNALDPGGHGDKSQKIFESCKLEPPARDTIQAVAQSLRSYERCQVKREATWDLFGGNQKRTRILDLEPPVELTEGMSNTDPSLGDVTLFSLWKDGAVNLESAVIVEDSTGFPIQHPVEVVGMQDWVNYTFPGDSLEKGKPIRFVIYVSDEQGNIESSEGSFKVG